MLSPSHSSLLQHSETHAAGCLPMHNVYRCHQQAAHCGVGPAAGYSVQSVEIAGPYNTAVYYSLLSA